MTVKHYKPTDPEFQEIAKTITPLHKIRSGVSHIQTYIDAEVCKTPKTRNETVDKIRGT